MPLRTGASGEQNHSICGVVYSRHRLDVVAMPDPRIDCKAFIVPVSVLQTNI